METRFGAAPEGYDTMDFCDEDRKVWHGVSRREDLKSHAE